MISRKSIFKRARKKKAIERRKKLVRYGGGLSVALLILAGVFAFFSDHPRVSIQNIEVSGNEIVGVDQIRRVAEREMEGRHIKLFAKNSTALYPEGAIRKALAETFPRLASIDISLQSLTALSIAVSERKPAFLVCRSGEQAGKQSACYFADERGFIFAQAPHFSGDAYIRIFNSKKKNFLGTFATSDSDLFAHIRALKDMLIERGVAIRTIQIGEHSEYIFVLDNGVDLRFNMSESPERFTDNFNSILQEVPLSADIDYIDFRFGNKVFYQ